jgi:two-component system, cell cycle response regulator
MAGELVRILLVEKSQDDYARVRKILSEIKEFETTLTWEKTYLAALERLKNEIMDVILVNDGHSDGTGLEFVREVQTRGYLMPIILLTQEAVPNLEQATGKFGAVDYLEKDQLTATLLMRTIRYAMQRAQLLIEMRDLAIHDDLTGLFNRREFYRMLAEETNRCLRYGRPMALLMCDLDRFKEINDCCGRVTGDEVLRQWAQAMRKVLRAVDRPARYGGDKFAVILPETSAEAARLVAERLCHEMPPLVDAALKAAGATLPGPFTLSVAMAELPRDADKAHMLIEKVNQALYAAKSRGGNTVVLARLFTPLPKPTPR